MDLLERLTQTPAVPGRESRMRDLILRETKGLFDEARVDPLGSLICTRRARFKGAKRRGKPLSVMLACHMDQIGFMVKFIDSKGYLRVNNLGGFDVRNLFARLVTVCTDDGDLPGVMNPGGRPIHIATEEDKKKIPEISDLVIDLGLPVETVKKKVKIGDMVVIRAPFTRVGNTAVAQAMDNRIACWLAIRAVQTIANPRAGHHCDVHAVFTVQEEVGCRGAGPASYGLEPDIAITLDTTLAVDTPGVPEDQSVTQQGAGAGLLVMDSGAISDEKLLREFEDLAHRKKIKVQRTILPRGGTDAATIQRTAAGYRVMVLVCPTRYIHTITEMIHLDDLYACRDLLTEYLKQAQ